MIKIIALGLVLFTCNVLFYFFENSFLSAFFIQFLFSVGFGACWNIIAGLCGYYSFGHAIYAGIASYLMVYALDFTAIPFIIALIGVLFICMGLGAFLIFVSTHFAVDQAYFTLLTIAFLECGRIFFEVIPWFGASAGLFLHTDKIPHLFLHAFTPILSISVFLIIFLCFILFKSDLGYKCRAVKDNKNAAQAFGISASRGAIFVMSLSTLITGYLGVLHVLYQKNLFPDQVFSMQRSMGFTLSPLIGGIGTVFGPIIGSLFLLPLGELIDICIDIFKFEAPGVKQIVFGSILLFVIFKKPNGILRKTNKYVQQNSKS